MNESDLPPSYDDVFSQLSIENEDGLIGATAPPLYDNLENSFSSGPSSSHSDVYPSAPFIGFSGQSSSNSEYSPSAPSVNALIDGKEDNVDYKRERLGREILAIFSVLDNKSGELSNYVSQWDGIGEDLEIKKDVITWEMTDQKENLVKKINDIFEEKKKAFVSAYDKERDYATKRLQTLKNLREALAKMNAKVGRNVEVLSLHVLEVYHNVITKLYQDINYHFSTGNFTNVADRIIYDSRLVESLENVLQTACGNLQILPLYESQSVINSTTSANIDSLLLDISTLEQLEEPQETEGIFRQNHWFSSQLETEKDHCNPYSIDTLDDNILVADKNNQCVKLFSATGGLKHVYHLVPTIVGPSYIAVDKIRKFVYVSDVTLNTIHVFDSNGTLMSEYKKFIKPRGIAFANGCLYVPDASGGTIEVFDVNSQTLAMRIESEVHKPFYVTANTYGEIAVSDKETKNVQFFDKHGKLIVNKRHVKNPYGLAFKSDDELYIADYARNVVSMYNMPPRGNTVVLSNYLNLKLPTDLCFLSDNSIVVSEFMSGKIKIFDSLT